MQDHQERTEELLNGLIGNTLDSANGYREAAEHAENPQFKTLFADRGARREALAQRLQGEVRSFGGEPKDDQTVAGKAHNMWVGLKDALTGGKDDKSVIDEVERGEDFLKGRFEMALEDASLSDDARRVVGELYQTVKADHDEMSLIKRQFN